MEELKYNGYAMPSKTPWVASKPLKHKKPSQKQREMKKFFHTHDISMKKDPKTGKIICNVVTKNLNNQI